jgi:hypothetical protein
MPSVPQREFDVKQLKSLQRGGHLDHSNARPRFFTPYQTRLYVFLRG